MSEHGTFRVRWRADGDPGEYSSGALSTLTEAHDYESMLFGQGWAHVWIERATWEPLVVADSEFPPMTGAELDQLAADLGLHTHSTDPSPEGV